MVAFWLVVAVAGLVAEGLSQKFIAIWFAIGALAALLTALFDMHPGTQFLVFFAATGLLYVSTREMVKEHLAIKAQNTADAKEMPGTTCQVVETVDNVAGTGAIEYGGRTWEARAECTVRFESGTQVRVARLAKGVAFVEEPPPEEPAEELEGLEEPEEFEDGESIPEPEAEEGAVFELSGDV